MTTKSPLIVSCCPKTAKAMRNELQILIQSLDAAFAKKEVDIDTVMALMAEYFSDREHWNRFYHEHDKTYTRNLVSTGNGKYNLLMLVWGPGQGSAIHDHSKSHCFMKILQGRLTETRFDWPTEGEAPRMTTEKVLERDTCSYMHDKLGLHRVANRDERETAVSLHLYIPPFDRCRCFSQDTSESHEAVINFYSRDGKIVFETPKSAN